MKVYGYGVMMIVVFDYGVLEVVEIDMILIMMT
jgi:hypothetical protein